MLTASFSEARQNLTEMADRVAHEGVEYTVFKRSRPLFKIVPVATNPVVSDGEGRSLGRLESFERYADRSSSRGKPIPPSGEDLLAYMLDMRSRAPKSERLDAMTVEDMRQELGERDV